MTRFSVLFYVLTTALIWPLVPAEAQSVQPQRQSMVALSTDNLPPALTATVVVSSVAKANDATGQTSERTFTYNRDSKGRFMIRSGHRISVVDSVARIHFTYDDQTKRGILRSLSKRPLIALDSPAVATDNREIEGISVGSKQFGTRWADGKRFIQVIPAGTMPGMENEITIETTLWHNHELSIPLAVEVNNSLTGITKTEYTNITISDPDPSLFKVPNDVTLEQANDVFSTADTWVFSNPK